VCSSCTRTHGQEAQRGPVGLSADGYEQGPARLETSERTKGYNLAGMCEMGVSYLDARVDFAESLLIVDDGAELGDLPAAAMRTLRLAVFQELHVSGKELLSVHTKGTIYDHNRFHMDGGECLCSSFCGHNLKQGT